MNILDEFSRECLTIRVKRRLNSTDVIDALTDLFILRGPPTFVRSDNGPEFVAKDVRGWIEAVGARTAFIEPGSPWENGYVESFNARFRDELLNREVFYSLREAQIVIENWRKHYNTKRPHSALGYRPPAPETIVPIDQRPIMHSQSNRTNQIRLGTMGAVRPDFAISSFVREIHSARLEIGTQQSVTNPTWPGFKALAA